MTLNMTALREGRQLSQVVIDNDAGVFPLVSGLIPNFDPNAPQANSSSSYIHLRIAPDSRADLEAFYRKKS